MNSRELRQTANTLSTLEKRFEKVSFCTRRGCILIQEELGSIRLFVGGPTGEGSLRVRTEAVRFPDHLKARLTGTHSSVDEFYDLYKSKTIEWLTDQIKDLA